MAIETKTISDLKGHCFFVPSYQRGYRWTAYEVTALLDDVNEFITEGNKQYCIQPLIVKKREEGFFEVVDGQQRLTTICIFMKIAQQEIRSAIPPYDLEFETRIDSADFLRSLSDDADLDEDKNIDFYHIAAAYRRINKWLEQQPDKSVAIQKLNTKIRESVFFIWYELPQGTDPIVMFTKVNLGKIPLTSAELIKALILNKDNFNEDANKRQTEISLAWDRIEQGLRDDLFWYFLNEKEESGTRIDILFKLLADEYNERLSIKIPTNQNYYPFLVFLSGLNSITDKKEREIFIKNLWDNAQKLYAEFQDWYADLNKYHIVGYLIAVGVKISDIFTLMRGKRKSAVTRGLLDRARKTIPGKIDDSILYNLTYGSDNSKIKRLLLLFNIATLVCKSEKQYRFPFDIFKGEKWDIEHIHATADETDEKDDSLWNLTLLDVGTNRSQKYADKPFDEKRKVILERESKGLFVPLCTKNIFLKVYSDDLTDMDKWADQDKLNYIFAMERTLDVFFEGGFDR